MVIILVFIVILQPKKLKSMFTQFLYVFSVVIIMLAILGIFLYKAGLQLQYLRIQRKVAKGSASDIIQFDYSDKKERKERLEAFLLFPLMYGIVFEENEKEELMAIKKRVKKIHITIYSLLIVVIVLAVYSEKVFPAAV